MVGATNVGRMSASFDPGLVTNTGSPGEVKFYDPPVPIKVGEELGIFHMGSTVVMLYPPGKVTLPPASGPVRLGEAF
jgi:phosphatidylserine decarboxylase